MARPLVVVCSVLVEDEAEVLAISVVAITPVLGSTFVVDKELVVRPTLDGCIVVGNEVGTTLIGTSVVPTG